MADGRKVVLDSGVLVGLVLADEPWHVRAHEVLRDVAAGLLVPMVAPNVRFDVRNALVRAARRGRIAWERVIPGLTAIDALRLPVGRIAYLDQDLVELCRSLGLAWGDAHPVLLAQRYGAALVTADRRLVRTLERVPIWVESIADRPPG